MHTIFWTKYGNPFMEPRLNYFLYLNRCRQWLTIFQQITIRVLMKIHVTLQVALTKADISQNLTISIFLELILMWGRYWKKMHNIFFIYIFLFIVKRGEGAVYIFFISQIASCMTSANKRWTIFGRRWSMNADKSSYLFFFNNISSVLIT
jgi:hypothetical protein